MIAYIMNPSSEYSYLAPVCLEALTALISSDRAVGPVVSYTFLPCITTSLSHSINSGSPLELILVQMLFVIFNSLAEEQVKSEYVLYILPALCKLFQASPSLDKPASQFAGKGMTHIARTSPEILRYVIPKLDESSRGSLQAAMRLAMELEQQSQTVSQSAQTASKPLALKRIDSVKFKK
jgi:hypothetical protein